MNTKIPGQRGEALAFNYLIENNYKILNTNFSCKLGEIDISVFERIKAIHDILPQIKQMSEKIQYIDLSWKDSKYLKME